VDPLNIPIYITVRDRVSDLRKLVAWLEAAGHQRINLIDNDSTYGPCCDFLDHTPHKVYRLSRNLGARALWDAHMVPNEHFIVSDPDLVPIGDCPPDLVERLVWLLPLSSYGKVGAGLHLDDLPGTLPSLEWERELVAEHRKIVPGAYNSLVDTTFALYRPGAEFAYEAIRTGYPYQMRHSSWYCDSGNLRDEDRYYLEHASSEGPTGSSWKAGLSDGRYDA